MNTDEKFISIPYSIWLSKYKPMDNKVFELEMEIKHLQSRNDAKIGIWTHYSIYDQDIQVGSISFDIVPPDKDKMSERMRTKFQDQDLAKVIEWELDKSLGRGPLKMKILDKVAVAMTLDSFKKQSDEIHEKIERNTKIIAGIPWIIKWLFKIK